MDTDDREKLCQYRLQQAKDTVLEAELLTEHRKYRAAVNRIYYGIFYSLSALATRYGFDTSKHGRLIGWFNKEFIKTGIFDQSFGKILRDAFELRNQGDYDAYIEFNSPEVRIWLKEMKKFIESIEAHLSDTT